MSPSGRISRFQLWLGGIAGGGVLAAHALAYLLAAPDSHFRHELLATTGHRYWVLISGIALAGVAAGLARLALAVGRERSELSVRQMYFGAAARLAVLQITGFTLLEFLERALGHADTNLLGQPVFRIGIVVQVLVALVAAALLVLFSRTVLALKRRSAPTTTTRAPQAFALFERAFVLRPQIAVGAGTLRGPPENS